MFGTLESAGRDGVGECEERAFIAMLPLKMRERSMNPIFLGVAKAVRLAGDENICIRGMAEVA